MITIWQGMTIQGLHCYLNMGNNTVMYYKCSHVLYAVNSFWIVLFWKNMEKRPFFRAAMAGLGKYRTGSNGRIGV